MIDVIITCHNQEHWIAEAVASALTQGVDVAVTIVDDGSSDGSPDVLTAFAPEVRVHRNPTPVGVSSARNQGLSLTRHELVLFLDGDDRLGSGFLQAALTVLKEAPHAGFAYPTILQFGANDQRSGPPPWDTRRLATCNFVPIASLFRREAIGSARFRQLPTREDWEFVLQLADRGVTGVPCPAAVWEYRKHVGGGSRYDRAASNRALSTRVEALIALRHWRLTGVALTARRAARAAKWATVHGLASTARRPGERV